MKPFLWFILSLAAFIVAVFALAAGIRTAAAMRNDTFYHIINRAQNEDEHARNYIMGIWDGLRWANVYNYNNKNPLLFCPPDSLSPAKDKKRETREGENRVLQILEDGLNVRPELKKVSVAMGVVILSIKLFPCKKEASNE